MPAAQTLLGRPPRAVGDVPVVAPEVIAKAWLAELVSARPLAVSATLPVADLATQGPLLCGLLLDAVRSAEGLVAMAAADLPARAGTLGGADGPGDAVAVVEALRVAAWRELTAALPGAADPGLLGDLAHRLAHVCAVVCQAAVSATATHPGGPRALLLLEVDDLQRLEAAEPEGELVVELAGLERELVAVLAPGDRLRRERPGRWTVVAPGLDRAGARELAERLSRAFAACAPLRHGARLTLSIGLAAGNGEELGSQAEAGLFAARAAGVPVV